MQYKYKIYVYWLQIVPKHSFFFFYTNCGLKKKFLKSSTKVHNLVLVFISSEDKTTNYSFFGFKHSYINYFSLIANEIPILW